MRKMIGGLALVLMVAGAVAPAAAQRAAQRPAAPTAKHEFGMDVGLAFYDPDGGDSGFKIGTPLDIRVGFVSRGKLMWEPRLVFELDSEGGGSGQSASFIAPGVNALYSMSPGGHRNGMFLTGGAGLNLVSGGGVSGTGLSLNAAVGWRKPYGSTGAFRFEVGIKYDTEIADGGAILVPSTLNIGGRVGLSLWH